MQVSRQVLPGIVGLAIAALCWFGFVWVFWRAVPSSNTAERRFDAILVLGSPCRSDGAASATQKVRVDEGIRQWRAGVAPRMILSGGPAHNRWVEAECMAQYAQQQGVPAADIVLERQAQDTIQNMYYSAQILRAHSWRSVDVVSSWYHLPRAALILEHFPFQWRTDGAPWPRSYNLFERTGKDWAEAFYCLKLRMHGFHPSRFISRWPDRSNPPQCQQGKRLTLDT